MRTRLAGVLKDGLIGGLLAYFAVVVAFAVMNAAQGLSVFHTAAAMGAVLFRGGDTASVVALEPGPILAYNAIHLLGSLVVATAAAFVVFEAEQHHSLWYVGLMLLIAVGFYAILVFGVAGVEIGGVLGWGTVLVGTAVWVGAMTAYLLGAHRGLLAGIRAEAAT
ncbi:MAG: hypothetical protein P8188_14780 [Gemmatimonadota bacterium]|jgi:hypothetical protein